MIETWKRQLASEPYFDRGIPHSEMAFIISIVRDLGIDVFLESGRRNGQSTLMLSKYLVIGSKVISVEKVLREDEEGALRSRLTNPNVTLVYGDGRDELPELAKKCSGRYTAVLCDGPKGFQAIDVLKQCFQYPWVVVGFIHDMRRLDHGEPSPFRAKAIETFPHYRFSDDPAYAEASWMDDPVREAKGPVGPEHEAVYGSYGPTVGAFFNR